MSFSPVPDPAPGDAAAGDAIDLVIVPRSVDLGGFAVRRALPHVKRRMVGPFIFFDHFGPVEFRTGQGIDVRPHPHIGLATVTFLFDGEIMHRDSLGNDKAIHPGDVNLMTAGRGIVHSERTAPDHRAGGERLHGVQLWLAMPSGDEEIAPAFAHHDQANLPVVAGDGKIVRVVIGSLYGKRSPVPTLSDTIFADAALTPGAVLPIDAQARGARPLRGGGRDRHRGRPVRGRPAPGVAARRSDVGDGGERGARHPGRRRRYGRTSSHLVELRVVAQGAHRAGQGRLEARPLRYGAGG